MKKNFLIWLLFAGIAGAAGCKEKYNPQLATPFTGYLVVEGFINGNGPTEITLSRTLRLEDSSDVHKETGAVVMVEAENGPAFQLEQTLPGVYTASALPIESGQAYRLHIYANGNEYQSAYAKKIATPPIEAMPYTKEDDGVHIRLQAEDPATSSQTMAPG
ncbi:MAG: DUF4249 family protein, partial [Flavihumibacter sp.]